MSDYDFYALEDCAHRMADAAAAAILPYFRSESLAAVNKDADGFDPVTEADRAGERAMRNVVADMRPDDAILGEEYGQTPGSSGLTWVLDPIDGTRAFLCGAPTWGCLIAVNAGGPPLMGLIDQPHTGERFFGGPDGATLRYGGIRRPLRCRAPNPLSDAVLMTTFPEVGTENDRLAFNRVQDAAKLTRYGLDCYGYALVAAGTVDLVIEVGLAAYDIQGPMAVVTAAGGIVTDWEGGPVQDGGRAVAAANADIHAQALQLLNA